MDIPYGHHLHALYTPFPFVLSPQKSALFPPVSRPGGSHISSDWQEQQLQQGAGREAADNRWREHMYALRSTR